MDVHREGDLEFGPDPVRGGDQNRVAVVPALEIEEAAEAADAHQEAWAGRLESDRTDAAHQAVRSGDIHSGPFVGYAFFLSHRN